MNRNVSLWKRVASDGLVVNRNNLAGGDFSGVFDMGTRDSGPSEVGRPKSVRSRGPDLFQRRITQPASGLSCYSR